MLHTEDSSLDRRRTQSGPRRKPEAGASASSQRAHTPYPGSERGQLAHGWQLERPRPPPTATPPRPAGRRKWRMFWRLRAGRGVNGGDAFSFYLLRFQARLLSSGPQKASGLRAPQAERARPGSVESSVALRNAEGELTKLQKVKAVRSPCAQGRPPSPGSAQPSLPPSTSPAALE
ncbi:unnamed protein product [Rangifer tarandus platyrhynchus]|uniref:Uncharacterized protein n=2 Tax=Rangifer tarandus platyrhynchus TaxID=3082113 RepID=A0ACB0FKF9_RANTA|nr:unnamed protein product [Rangifer tarandus platyrhynchus]CAI9713227.1 unnamed protein product [Rangifer tarandus platyrhynchus]